MTKTFKPGDKIRENRLMAPVETVITVYENAIITDRGFIHPTKAIKA